MFDQPLRQPFLFRDAVQVGHMPQFATLIGQRLDQRRMPVAQRIHRDARPKIKIALAIVGKKP